MPEGAAARLPWAWVEPGRLLTGEHPALPGRGAAPARLAALLAAGVTYFIDLSRAGEAPPYDHLLPPERSTDQRYVIYVRQALPAQTPPASAQTMAGVLDYLERALEVGHVVYVHGAAEQGRCLAVLGCWLRRRGLDAPAALARLRELQPGGDASSPANGAVSAAQRRYVCEWQEPGPEPPEVDWAGARQLYERYQGAVRGLACGDALGASVQFLEPGRFAPLSAPRGGGRWQLPPGAWTDDTALFLCVAESLTACEACDGEDQRRRWRRWQRAGVNSSTGECVGISAAVARALAADVGQAPGSPGIGVDEEPRDAALEALPRAAAAVLFAASDPPRALEWAAEVGALSHPGPRARALCRRYAALLLAALRGAARGALEAEAEAYLREAGGAPAPRGGDPWAALRWLLLALEVEGGLRAGLLSVVNQGGAADVRGALVGQLGGALYGQAALPPAWRAGLLRPDLLDAAVDRLVAAALAPRQ